MKKSILALTMVLYFLCKARGQSSFQDLNFESPNNLPPTGTGGVSVAVSNAFPGWTVYEGGTQASQVDYGSVSAGGVQVTLISPNAGSYTNYAIQGNYTATLDGGEGGNGQAMLAQTGLVPTGSLSLLFDANLNVIGYLTVAVNGQTLPIYQLEAEDNYQAYGVNISQYAGQTVDLSFTETPTASTPFAIAFLNGVQFSDQQIPEPQTWTLLLCGACALAAWRRKQTQ